MSNSFLKRTFDFLFLPIRIIFKDEQVRKMGLTPINDEIHKIIAPYVKGKLLDVGCGKIYLQEIIVKELGLMFTNGKVLMPLLTLAICPSSLIHLIPLLSWQILATSLYKLGRRYWRRLDVFSKMMAKF